MKKIGNIIVSSPNSKVDDCYNKFLSLSNVDNNLPTMIIGLKNAKQNIERRKAALPVTSVVVVIRR